MASGSTPTYSIPYLTSIDPVNLTGDTHDLATRLEEILVTKIANPMTTIGDVILGGSGGAPTRLPIGTNTYVLTSNGTTASWESSVPGIQGIIGSQGVTGIQGFTGIQGTAGFIGSDGSQGVQGITGSGVQGSTGIQGLTGTQGLTGSGTQGTTGTDATTINTLFTSPSEFTNIVGSAPGATQNIDTNTSQDWLFTTNTANNFAPNIRASSGATFNSVTGIGDTKVINIRVKSGTTAYYLTAITIDGGAQTVQWSGGIAPYSGSASASDIYTFAITKTASATFTVMGTRTLFS